MRNRTASRKLSAHIVILACCLALCALACQVQPVKINASLTPQRVFVKHQFRLQPEFLKNGQKINAPTGDIDYRADHGEMEGDLYIAPKTPGEETITIRHLPSKSETEVRFTVLPAPRLILEIERTNLNCDETLPVIPVLVVGDEKEQLAASEFVYKAKRGNFINNDYHAPQREGNDTISVYCPAFGIEMSKTLKITSDAILIAEISHTIPCNGKTPMSFSLKKKGRITPVSAQDVNVIPKNGKWLDGDYLAPAAPCHDEIVVEHKISGRRITVQIEVEAWEVKFAFPVEKLTYDETMVIEPQAYRAGKAVNSKIADFRFSAIRGSFTKNIYRAPTSEGKDTITVKYIPANLKLSKKFPIEYTPYRVFQTQRFTIPIPTGWQLEKTDIGFVAKSPDENSNSSIIATVLPGFDFLDIATMKLLFQQQIDSDSQDIEETSEDEITIADTKGLRITFENYSGLSEKSWWIFIKRDGASYILAFQGDQNFFETDKIPQHIMENFQFKKMEFSANQNFKITTKMRQIDQESFTLYIPETWKSHNVNGGFLSGISKTNEGIAAISEVNETGRSFVLFILAHRQPEVRNFDLSLLLVLLRQMIKDTEVVEEKEVRDIDLDYGQAKVLEIEGGTDIMQRTWLVATKYESTAYGILLRGPVKIWEANPDIAENLLKSFVPKQ